MTYSKELCCRIRTEGAIVIRKLQLTSTVLANYFVLYKRLNLYTIFHIITIILIYFESKIQLYLEKRKRFSKIFPDIHISVFTLSRLPLESFGTVPVRREEPKPIRLRATLCHPINPIRSNHDLLPASIHSLAPIPP